MNDHHPMSRRVNDALAGVDPARAAGVRAALADYMPGDRDGLMSLMFQLELVVGDDAALAALDMHPPKRGLVWCCTSLGWVTPTERFDHRWDAYSGMD